jgi:FKBP-type peptidyl-prolyl cis-trans isomerase FklB
MSGRLPYQFLLAILVIGLFTAKQTLIAQDSASSERLDTISYSLGMSLGLRLKNQGAADLNYASLFRGIQEALTGQKLLLSREESDRMNYEYFQQQRDNMFTEIKAAGESFLATNGQRPEVTTTESGLQYEILKNAEGPKPSASSSVTVHYEGFLIDGNMFDSSVARGEPATFPLNRVISGWTEGLQYMPVGSKFKFFIPSDLGYGSRGAGADIPPYSTLIFEVELLDIK